MGIIKLNENELKCFTIEAKLNGWASGKKAKKLSDGGREFVYKKGLYQYRDVYYGSPNFLGTEIVWWKNNAVWAMGYYGMVDNAACEEDINTVLNEALNRVEDIINMLVPVRGPYEYDSKKKAGYKYLNEPQGHFGKFAGTERVVKEQSLPFLLWYQGGMIQKIT